ncbi:MFS transporter [Fluviispira vulneris]|uniref:MFS transporter n=1 Tax=Fluviispira vulneris TaxID=2763012 RepID=UPI0016485B64|nr:MFS transporter [Fluviispira vulneris]
MINKKTIYISSVGGSLEFFDFMIFIYLYPVLIKKFFPETTNSFVATLITIMTIILSYIAKPVGGIIYGIIGDRYGIDKSFKSILFLISISTLGIAFLPTYSDIGFLSTVLLVLIRIIQGIANGGDVPTTVVYIFENNDDKISALSFLFFCFTMGSTVASLFASLFLNFKYFFPENIYFRIPFMIGGFSTLLAYYMRKKYIYIHKKKNNNFNFVKIFNLDNFKKLSNYILIYGFGNTLMANYFVITPNVYINKVYKNHNNIEYIISLSLFIMAALSFVSGKISLKIGFKRNYYIGILLCIIFAPFYFYMIGSGNILNFCIAQLSAGLVCAPIFGNIYMLICSQLEDLNRLTNFGIICNIATSIFPSLTSAIVILLINHNVINILPSLIIITYGVFLIFLLLRSKINKKQELI